MPRRVVVVGGSLAGLRAAEGARSAGHDGPLTIVGAEAHLPYDRPPLSKQVLTGKVGAESTLLHIEEGFDADWVLGTAATGLDVERRVVRLAGGEELPFDGLVIATGASPRRLPGFAPGPGVHYLRTVEDSLELREALMRSEHAVVVGAGFIGLEVAGSASEMGVKVTVLEALPVPLENAIGAEMGAALAEWHRAKGLDLRLGIGVSGMGAGRVNLSDDTAIDADVVIVGVGVAPETGWLSGSGVDIDNGVVCDERLRVLVGGKPHPEIVAAGDVARWLHPGYGSRVRIEHWTNAAEQGEVAGHVLIRGEEIAPYAPVPYFWSDQHGVKIQFVGRAEPDDEVTLVEGHPGDERFVAAYGRRGRLVAALGMRRPARVMALQRAIDEGAPFPPPPA